MSILAEMIANIEVADLAVKTVNLVSLKSQRKLERLRQDSAIPEAVATFRLSNRRDIGMRAVCSEESRWFGSPSPSVPNNSAVRPSTGRS